MGIAFPLDHGNKVGKPPCSWRSKVKHCLSCGGVITNLPRSQFLLREYCSRQCVRDAKLNSKANVNTDNTLAAGVLIADVAHAVTGWEWKICAGFAVNFILDYHYSKL